MLMNHGIPPEYFAFLYEGNWLKTIVSIVFFFPNLSRTLEFTLTCKSYADRNNVKCTGLLLLLW